MCVARNNLLKLIFFQILRDIFCDRYKFFDIIFRISRFIQIFRENTISFLKNPDFLIQVRGKTEVIRFTRIHSRQLQKKGSYSLYVLIVLLKLIVDLFRHYLWTWLILKEVGTEIRGFSTKFKISAVFIWNLWFSL